MCELIKNAEKYITSQKLLSNNDRVGIAVSGGVDSMCLLDVLHKLSDRFNLKIFVLHYEHGIRESDSMDDANFVKNYCKTIGVPFIIESGDVTNLSKENKTSIETTARKVRYDFFVRCCNTYKLDKVALAHHIEDQAETILLNLTRGSGAVGMSGMLAYRPPNYIRPFLNISKKDLYEYAEKSDIPYVVDNTNLDTKYSRNRIRQNVIVDLEKINKNAVSNILRTSKIISQDNDFINSSVDIEYLKRVKFIDGEIEIELNGLSDMHVAIKRRLLRKAISQYYSIIDVEFNHIEYIINSIDGKSGKWLDIGNGLAAAISYDKLYIFENHVVEPINEPLSYAQQPFVVSGFEFCCEICTDYQFSLKAEYFDLSMMKNCSFRYPKENDFIHPLGMSGKKKLTDYMCDKKIPLHKRGRTLLLIIDDEVVWVVGYGINDRFKVLSETKEVIKISYKKI